MSMKRTERVLGPTPTESLDTTTSSRPYELMARYGVTKLFTAPIALHMLRRAGDTGEATADLTNLDNPDAIEVPGAEPRGGRSDEL